MTATDRADLVYQDQIKVAQDGEDVDVYNWVNITQLTESVLRGDVSHEERTTDAVIGAGDSKTTPDAVTHWVANDLALEHGIDVTDHGIDVIDVESDEVTIL